MSGLAPLTPAERAAIAAWLASNTPQRCPFLRTPRPRPHEGAPVHSFSKGQLISRDLLQAQKAGLARIEIPADCEIASDGRVRPPVKPRGRPRKVAA